MRTVTVLPKCTLTACFPRRRRSTRYVPPAEYEASNSREQVLAEAGTQ